MSVDYGTFGQIDKQYVRHTAWQEAESVGILRLIEEGDNPNFLVRIQKKGWTEDDPSLWCILIPQLGLNKGYIIMPSGNAMFIKDRIKSFVMSEICRHNSEIMDEFDLNEKRKDGISVIKSSVSNCYILDLNEGNAPQDANGRLLPETIAEVISVEFGKSFPNLELNPFKLPKSVVDGIHCQFPDAY